MILSLQRQFDRIVKTIFFRGNDKWNSPTQLIQNILQTITKRIVWQGGNPFKVLVVQFPRALRGAGLAHWWERSPSTNVARVRFRPGAICGLSLLLVLALLWGFFSGFSGFPPSTKPTSPNSNSTRIEDPHENQLRLKWLPLQTL